ncbi:hypothetical protein [Halobacillus sp. Marseille-P3879]|uniref:DUF7010 family protein n=1 Tax=Halobacillus sp. Marseille-P3879 TaxID=2045014 RepID=UPI000C7DADA6|nr:hypothetical protein [Halobacillus sp. Marseille-P3879]
MGNGNKVEKAKNIQQLRLELALINKNGLPFLGAAFVVWLIITLVFSLSFNLNDKNIIMLFSTGITFPLAVLLSKLLKVDWKDKSNPLSILGLYLNVAQFIYFPLLFLVFVKYSVDTVTAFAIITGAHLFPYGWLYNTKVFYIMAPIITITTAGIGIFISSDDLWIIPLSVAVSLLILIVMLYRDYRSKVKEKSRLMKATISV